MNQKKKAIKDYQSYIVVFIGEYIGNKIYDIGGDDPCFCDPPTWGICRPNVRGDYLQVGKTIFFLACIKDTKEYILKGWLKVGEKIDYLEALSRYPKRMNVIIANQNNTSGRKILWGNSHLKKKYGENPPNYLLDIIVAQGTFYQNPADNHEIDNWKCKRIFRCRKPQLKKCDIKNICSKNYVNIKDKSYSNYIVAKEGEWENLDYLKITLCDIRKNIGFNKAVKHGFRHNPVPFDDYAEKLLDFIEERKNRF